MMRSPSGVAERVVVPLERGDIDEADGAPRAALLESEKRFELLDEAAEVHEPRLRIAVDAVGQIGDEILEVARDAAHRRVPRRSSSRILFIRSVKPLDTA